MMTQGNNDNRATGETFRLHGRAAMSTRGRGPQRNGRVVTVRVHPGALMTTLRLAKGNPARLHVISSSEIIVENNPRRPR